MKKIYYLLITFASIYVAGCSKDTTPEELFVIEGTYNRNYISGLNGFWDKKESILKTYNISEKEFISISTDSAWSLALERKENLKKIRNHIETPTSSTILQKIIPLSDIATYMENIYNGTVGGFLTYAADTKNIYTLKDIYYGLRLDYDGTKFKADGAGYAVIRFKSKEAPHITIPYCEELGGNTQHSWPNGGGGFTTSKLGYGGFPEWFSQSYMTPDENSEIYEITPAGREILRSVFKDGKWQTYESDFYYTPSTEYKSKSIDNTIRSGRYGNYHITTYGYYKGYKFIIRGCVDGLYHLTTHLKYPIEELNCIDKGLYGIIVKKDNVTNITEEKIEL